MGRPRKSHISRFTVSEAALRIIDAEGLEALNISRLGAELNIRGSSLYHHFSNKDEIIIGACEIALSELNHAWPGNIPWRDWIIDFAAEYWLALRRHPNLIPVMVRRHALRIGLAADNTAAGLLAIQGVHPQTVLSLLEMLEALALGYAACEWSAAYDTPDDNWSEQHPILFHVRRKESLSRGHVFEASARAVIDAVIGVSDPMISTVKRRPEVMC